MRYATKNELVDYLHHHKDFILLTIRGLEDIEVKEDEQGAFLLFIVRESNEDTRTGSPEIAAETISWPAHYPRVKARVKIDRAQSV